MVLRTSVLWPLSCVCESGICAIAACKQPCNLLCRAMPPTPVYNLLSGNLTAAMKVKAVASGDLRSSRWTHNHLPPWNAAKVVPPGVFGRLTTKMTWTCLPFATYSSFHSSIPLKFSSSSIALCLAHEMRSLLRCPEEHCTRIYVPPSFTVDMCFLWGVKMLKVHTHCIEAHIRTWWTPSNTMYNIYKYIYYLWYREKHHTPCTYIRGGTDQVCSWLKIVSHITGYHAIMLNYLVLSQSKKVIVYC